MDIKIFNFKSRKSISRLLSVQALYALHNNSHYKDNLDDLMEDALNFQIAKCNKCFFRSLLALCIKYGNQINNILDKYVENNYSQMRISILNRSIIITAIVELLYFSETDFAIVLSEFLLVGGLFCDESSVKFMNAMVEKLRDEFAKNYTLDVVA